jgi:hypothetical protein
MRGTACGVHSTAVRARAHGRKQFRFFVKNTLDKRGPGCLLVCQREGSDAERLSASGRAFKGVPERVWESI